MNRRHLFAMLVIAGSLFASPFLSYAKEASPVITSFKMSSPFEAGEEFVLTVANITEFPDSVTVSFGQVPAKITDITGNVIKAIVPNGVPPEGAEIRVTIGDKKYTYDLRVPVIETVFMPKMAVGSEIIISGRNFEVGKCGAKIDDVALTVNRCTARQIFAPITKNIRAGKLTVQSYGFTSLPVKFDVVTPKIDFVESDEGILPSSLITLHGSGFVTTAPIEAFLDNSPVEIAERVSDSILRVRLPEGSADGLLRVVMNGIESNTIKLASILPPLVTGYSMIKRDGEDVVRITGKQFSRIAPENRVFFDGALANVIESGTDSIITNLPSRVKSGCLEVETFGQRSNCIPFKYKGPVISKLSVPIFAEFEAKYYYTLDVHNLNAPEKDVDVFVDGTRAEITDFSPSHIEVRVDKMPEKGTVYLVAKGRQSNTVPYDVGKVFYPVISAIDAPDGFAPGRPIIIRGGRFGRHSNRDQLRINLRNATLAKKGNEIDYKITPIDINTRLSNNSVIGRDALLSVTVKGKTSNEIAFKIDPAVKGVTRGPSIDELRYPEGAQIGKKIRILGAGFDSIPANNRIFFDDIVTSPSKASAGFLEVTIPDGVNEKGSIFVESNNKTSNSLTFIAKPKGASLLTFEFESGDDSKVVEVNRQVSLGRIRLNNQLGTIFVEDMTFELIYNDDENNPNTMRKLGVRPFGTFQLVNLQNTNQKIEPAVATFDGRNRRFVITFNDFELNPDADEQILEFRTTVRPYALDGATVQIGFNPSSVTDFRAFHTDASDESIIRIKQSSIKSEVNTVDNKTAFCVDSLADNSNCDVFLGVTIDKDVLNIIDGITEPTPSLPAPRRVKDSVVSTPSDGVPVAKKRERIPLSDAWKQKSGPTIPFSDIREFDERTYIMELKKRGVVQGFENNEFKPKKIVNRAEFLKMVVSGLQIDTSFFTVDISQFSDVPLDAWFTPYVAWALENGVVQGYADGTFRPDNWITRAEALKILLTAGAFDLTTVNHPFGDTDSWQDPYIGEALKQNLIQRATKIKPNEAINRAESAKLITLMLHSYETEVK